MENVPFNPLCIEVKCCASCKFAVDGMVVHNAGVDIGAYGDIISRLTYDRVTKCTRSWNVVKIYYTCEDKA